MRLLVHVEGQTEETFVNEVLRPHLLSKGFASVIPRLVGNARLKRNRGGIKAWQSVRAEIVNHLKSDGGATATLMVDYYAMPQTGPNAWPGRASSEALTGTVAKAACLEQALHADVSAQFRTGFDGRRFIPYVLMYEFEGLLFSDCEAFARGIDQNSAAEEFKAIRSQFDSPEDINDSPATAPSKRILNIIPGYEKPLHGNVAALEIGLLTIRQQCSHFDDWLRRLENAGASLAGAASLSLSHASHSTD